MERFCIAEREKGDGLKDSGLLLNSMRSLKQNDLDLRPVWKNRRHAVCGEAANPCVHASVKAHAHNEFNVRHVRIHRRTTAYLIVQCRGCLLVLIYEHTNTRSNGVTRVSHIENQSQRLLSVPHTRSRQASKAAETSEYLPPVKRVTNSGCSASLHDPLTLTFLPLYSYIPVFTLFNSIRAYRQ